MNYNWPKVVPVAEYPIISEEEAYERILAGHAPWAVLPEILTSVKLSYDQAGRLAQSENVYAVPTYRFYGDEAEVVIVPALPNECLLTAELEPVGPSEPCLLQGS